MLHLMQHACTPGSYVAFADPPSRRPRRGSSTARRNGAARGARIRAPHTLGIPMAPRKSIPDHGGQLERQQVPATGRNSFLVRFARQADGHLARGEGFFWLGFDVCHRSDMCLHLHRQIFSHLPPISLLYLSRTSRDIRAVLRDKAAAGYTWKHALDREEYGGLPKCAFDMTEISWTWLVFAMECAVSALPPSHLS